MDPYDEIKQLKYRYLRYLDLKRWTDFADCFVPEATGDYDGLTFSHRDDLVRFMQDNMGPGLISFHTVHHPELQVSGDRVGSRATGVWYLEDKIFVPEHDFAMEGAAFYRDRYVCTYDGWRIAHTGYRRTWEASWSTAELPSYRVKRGSAFDA